MQRRFDNKLGTRADALAPCENLAAVNLHDSSHEGQAQPQAAAAPIETMFRLNESFENLRKNGGIYPDSRVPDGQDGNRPVGVPFQSDDDLAAAVRELHGIPKQVANHLREPQGVSRRVYCAAGKFGLQLDPHFLKRRTPILYYLVHECAEIETLGADLHLALGQPGKIQHIVHQPRQRFVLTLHQEPHPFDHGRLGPGKLEYLQGITKGGQGVPELVSENAQDTQQPLPTAVPVVTAPFSAATAEVEQARKALTLEAIASSK